MKIFETVYKLSGKIDSTFPAIFGSASKNIEKLNKRIIELNKVNKNAEGYVNLKKEIKELEDSYKLAQSQVDKFAAELKESENIVKSLKTQYDSATNNLKKLEEQISKTENPSNELKEEFKQAKEQVKTLAKELKQAERPLKEIQNNFEKAKDKASKLKEKIEQKNTKLIQLRDLLKSAGISTINFANDTAKLNKELDRATKTQKRLIEYQKRAEELKSKRQNARAEMLSAIETAMILQQPIRQAIKFENAMAEVRKVVDFDAPEQFRQMGKDIVELSKKIPMTVEGLAAIVAAGGQAGIARDELVKYAETAAKMGIAFDISAEEAGEMMAQWRSAFKMNQRQVEALADQINYLGNTTAASAPKISEVVKRIGPLGSVGGAAAGEIAALGATMVSTGISEEIAATGIKNLILSLTAGEAATKSQQAAFKALGLNAVTMAKLMQKDAQGAILTVLNAMQKLPKHKQAAVLTDLFGKESVGAIAPLLTNLNALKDNFNKVGNSALYAGSMQREFETKSDTTENKLILLKNTLDSLSNSIGLILLPQLKAMADIATKGANIIQNLSDKYPGLTRVITLAGASVLGFGVAWKTLSYVGTIVSAPFIQLNALMLKYGLISKEVTWATRAQAAAQKVLNFVMTANPILKVIMLLAALGTALIVLYKKNEKFRNMINSIGNAFKTVAETSINYFIDKINLLIGLLNKVKVPSWVPLIGGKGFNIKQISKVEFDGKKIGENATGTSNWHGGWTLVGERGPELVKLPKGSAIYNSTKTQKLLQLSQQREIVNGDFRTMKSSISNITNSISRNESDNIVINIKQEFNINGNSSIDTNTIKNIIQKETKEVISNLNLKDMLKRIKNDERRLSFAD
ncbi:phage tail tape measure protein [Caloramator australicus]|uniref:Phage tail length tape-measure protein n=1 Tax=Caloramator australicus RC3 TaxID=857293 RepID=I7KT82_9CLOT|nr:phage tail tape measure protein [Caloramator australicus]CCJ32893.1 Phage tail length tape-measure protein [Caloramator australicus RC3]